MSVERHPVNYRCATPFLNISGVWAIRNSRCQLKSQIARQTSTVVYTYKLGSYYTSMDVLYSIIVSQISKGLRGVARESLRSRARVKIEKKRMEK